VDDLFSQLGGEVLGIVKEKYPAAGAGAKTVDELMNIVIEQRNDARKRRDYAAADALRDKLEKMGIVLEDKPEATLWRFK
jgi:cysteinyl-tRNA synthetase